MVSPAGLSHKRKQTSSPFPRPEAESTGQYPSMPREQEPDPTEDAAKENEPIEEGDQAIEGQQRDEEETSDAPPFHPCPPLHELFDISTTVDPSFIIASIRKLIPTGTTNGGPSPGIGATDARGVECEAILCGDNCREAESMDIADDPNQSACRGGGQDGEPRGMDAKRSDAVWEEYGCVLWDLAASKTHAELMVENFILDVLLATLAVSQSVRVTEICLGILGNLACHEVSLSHITSNSRLIQIIVDQLFLDDSQCLGEAFRLLSSGIQISQCSAWAEAIRVEHTLSRMLWIIENTLNPTLLEKSIGLLLAILESQEEVSGHLLDSLMKLSLPTLLIDLFTFEMGQLTSERVPERFSVVDGVLRAIEVLSALDGYSKEICSSQKLSELLLDLVKLPDKYEVASSCVTAVVLVANILSDVPDLATKISVDLEFIQGLLEIFPLASSDYEARSAIWSIMARLLVQVKEKELNPASLHRYALLLSRRSELIEDDLLDQQVNNPNKESGSSSGHDTLLPARNAALQKIVNIVDQWAASEDHTEGKTVSGDHDDDASIARLSDCCRRHIGQHPF